MRLEGAIVVAIVVGWYADARAVPVSYRIDAAGTGPGTQEVTVTHVLDHGPGCPGCGWSGASCADAAVLSGFRLYILCPLGWGCYSNCFHTTFVDDAAPGPAKVTWSWVGPSGYWGSAMVNGLNPGYCGTAMSGEVSGNTPGGTIRCGGAWNVQLGGWCPCATTLQKCTNPGVYTFTVTFNYRKQTNNAPWTCSETGIMDVPADGAWHLAATSKCVAPNGDTEWAASLYAGAATAYAEGKMVADPGDIGSGNGPKLVVRVTGLKPCPPNCPPPESCLECVASGKTIAECQATGACPKNCPPYCPPPAGCPEDPSKCPPPPKCPPYCPPPAGCPEDPAKCPPGCPPICPPPEGCPPKCPEPPGCPPNCPPPDTCITCLNQGKTATQCQAEGACPENCPPACPPPPGCE